MVRGVAGHRGAGVEATSLGGEGGIEDQGVLRLVGKLCFNYE